MRTINKLRLFFAVTGIGILCYAYLITNHEQIMMEDLKIYGYIEEQEIPLSFWKDDSEGKYYLFLPAAFSEISPSDLIFRIEYKDIFYRLKIDGNTYKSGGKWNACKGEDECKLQMEDVWKTDKREYYFQVLTSTGLPSVMITAENIWEIENPQLVSAQKYVEMGTIRIMDTQGNIVLDEKMENFKTRGNVTRIIDKKPFTFTLTEPVSVCGMEKATKWILLANATDGSYLRNKIVLDIADAATTEYVPGAEYVDLFINGEYRGMYLLTEVAETGENRVPIKQENGWFMELEMEERRTYADYSFVTGQGQAIALHTDVLPDDLEQEKLQKAIKRAEEVICFGEQGHLKLEDVIDIESWAYVWAVQEIAGNCDVGITSQFFYTKEKSENAMLYAGPVWDFDATMGNTYVAMFRVPNALTSSVKETRAEYSLNQNRWMSALYQHEVFREAVAKAYKEKILPEASFMLQSGIEDYTNLIERSAQLDALRWHSNRLSWQYVLPENIAIQEEGDYRRFDTLECNVDMVRGFLEEKIRFLNEVFVFESEFNVEKEENTELILDSNKVIYRWVKKE